MNLYSLMGLIIAVVVLIVGFRLASDNMSMFVDYPSMFIVLGGTLAAAAISVQLNRVFALFKVFFQRLLYGKKFNYGSIITEIMQIGEAYRKGEKLENQIEKATDPFFKEALVMMSDGILEEAHIIRLMTVRAKEMLNQHMDEANKIKTVGKFPPAFGMMGTVIGMIVLLSNLGGEDAMKMIGPAMSVCLITTLYGVIVANLAFVPVSENLISNSKEIYVKNRIIVEGLKLIIQKTNPIIVAEELNTFLPPRERLDWKKIVGK